jgi:hypothetical protein
VDSGSSVNIIQPGANSSAIFSTAREPYGVTGTTLPVSGEQEVLFQMGGMSYRYTFLVCALPTMEIIGMDFLEPRNAIFNLEKRVLTLPSISVSPPGRKHDPCHQNARREDKYGLITHTFFPSTSRDDAHVAKASAPRNIMLSRI